MNFALIWDDLFRARSVKSIEEVAALTQQDVLQVNVVVNHSWFDATDGRVAIARTASIDGRAINDPHPPTMGAGDLNSSLQSLTPRPIFPSSRIRIAEINPSEYSRN
jgi:hypothetical protein